MWGQEVLMTDYYEEYIRPELEKLTVLLNS